MKSWRPDVTADLGRVARVTERFARRGVRLRSTVSDSSPLIRASYSDLGNYIACRYDAICIAYQGAVYHALVNAEREVGLWVSPSGFFGPFAYPRLTRTVPKDFTIEIQGLFL